MKRLFFSVVLGLGALGCNRASGPDGVATYDRSKSPDSSQVVARKEVVSRPDNTAINQRDRSDTAKTSIDQNEDQKDIDITAQIRKRVVDTKMSLNAHNAKIITQNGKVTLRGPVASEDEKKQIDEIATDVAGKGNVDNQLEIQP